MEHIVVKNHGKEKIDLRHLDGCQLLGYAIDEARITEIHMKEDGDLHDAPSFCLVAALPTKGYVYNQISLETLTDALNRLGFWLVAKEREMTCATCSYLKEKG